MRVELDLKAMGLRIRAQREHLNLTREEAGIQDEDNRILRENIMIPLKSCNRSQLKRAEQLLKVFVAAVNEDTNDYEI